MLCVPGYSPIQYAVYVFMLVDMFMLYYVHSVFGFWSDAGGKAPVSPDFGPMQWARPNMCFICFVWYVVVWGSSLSFVLTVSVLVLGTSTSKGKGSG